MPGQENVDNYLRIFRKYLLSTWTTEDYQTENLSTLVLKEITILGPNGPLRNGVFLWGENHESCGFIVADENGVIKLPVMDDVSPTNAKIDTLDFNEFTVDLSNPDPVVVVLTNAS